MAINPTIEQLAIRVGVSEGNRLKNGGYTKHYYGHTDPGNSKRNVGSFSYQGAAITPEAADQLWGRRLLNVTPKFNEALKGFKLTPEREAELYWNYVDLYTQSPAAATARGGYLDIITANPHIDIVEARVASYYNPDTGKLEAAGFGNNVRRLQADQRRRMEALRF